MPRALDPVISETLKKYEFGKDAVWDCHGVWVVYHRVLEQIAVKAGIKFDQPYVVECSPDSVAVCVTGHLGEMSIWSIGEAGPKNNKNAYKWAMAEKRAVDRVVLKLIGLHGLAYSEEEADDFKPPVKNVEADPVKDAISAAVTNPAPKKDPLQPWKGPLSKSELTKRLRALTSDLALCEDMDTLKACLSGYQGIIEQLKIDVPEWWDGEPDGNGFIPLKQRIEDRESLISQDPTKFLKAG